MILIINDCHLHRGCLPGTILTRPQNILSRIEVGIIYLWFALYPLPKGRGFRHIGLNRWLWF